MTGKATVTKTLLALSALSISGFAIAAAHDGSVAQPAGQSGDGHCNYVQQNMFAGPFRVCMSPASVSGCEVLGSTDDNRDAAHGDGECSMQGALGVCDMGDASIVYYEGDPGSLEIGCGFQGGEWVAP